MQPYSSINQPSSRNLDPASIRAPREEELQLLSLLYPGQRLEIRSEQTSRAKTRANVSREQFSKDSADSVKIKKTHLEMAARSIASCQKTKNEGSFVHKISRAQLLGTAENAIAGEPLTEEELDDLYQGNWSIA